MRRRILWTTALTSTFFCERTYVAGIVIPTFTKEMRTGRHKASSAETIVSTTLAKIPISRLPRAYAVTAKVERPMVLLEILASQTHTKGIVGQLAFCTAGIVVGSIGQLRVSQPIPQPTSVTRRAEITVAIGIAIQMQTSPTKTKQSPVSMRVIGARLRLGRLGLAI